MSVSACFVDTSAWFALFVPTDPDHGRVRAVLAHTQFKLLTTDYILDETLTALANISSTCTNYRSHAH